MICPFIFSQRPDYGKGDRIDCTSGCALWVESEKMCSFRLLADKEAYHRELRRRASQDADARGGPGE